MLTLNVNGEPQTAKPDTRLIDLLNTLNYNPQNVAVAINLTFVPRSQFDVYAINDDDNIEILSAVQGG